MWQIWCKVSHFHPKGFLQPPWVGFSRPNEISPKLHKMPPKCTKLTQIGLKLDYMESCKKTVGDWTASHSPGLREHMSASFENQEGWCCEHPLGNSNALSVTKFLKPGKKKCQKCPKMAFFGGCFRLSPQTFGGEKSNPAR